MALPIKYDKQQIAEFCRRNYIIKLAFFGSVLTERFGPESDVDVLIEYDPEHIPTLFDVVDMEEELGAMFGRKVDLRTPQDLSRYFRDEVVQSALVEYAA